MKRMHSLKSIKGNRSKQEIPAVRKRTTLLHFRSDLSFFNKFVFSRNRLLFNLL